MSKPKLILPSGAPVPETKPEDVKQAAPVEPGKLATASCSKCGALRPAEEVLHKACANCANIEALEQDLATRAEREAEQKQRVQRSGEDLKNLPDLDKTASALYDDERGVVWVGFNLKDEKLDPFGMVMLMDQAKGAAVGHLVAWRVAQQKKKSKIVRVFESVGGMMDRLKQAAGTKSPLLKP